MNFRVALASMALVCIVACTARGSCGAANCPLDRFRYLQAGWFRISLTHDYINQDRLFLGSERSYVGAVAEHHDEVSTLNERNTLSLQIGLLDRLGIAVDVPFVHREHAHIEHEGGTGTWASWNFNGMGDVSVSGQYALILPSKEFAPYVGLVAGVKFPTGVTDARNQAGEAAEITIQPGTGSYDGIVGLQYRQPLVSLPSVSGKYSVLPLTVGVQYQIDGAGRDNYRVGNALQMHLGTGYQVADRASLDLQINGRFQGYSDVGNTDEPKENTGGTWIFVSPGLGVQLTDAFSGSAYIQLPVYQNVHGLQQAAPFNLSLGLSYSLNVVGED